MSRKKGKEASEKSSGGESGTGRWMLTYLDMVTLLFGVFVILYAMSSANKAKFEKVAESLRAGFRGGITVFEGPLTGGQTVINDLYPPGSLKKRLFQRVKHLTGKELEKNIIIVTEVERGIQISLLDNSFFEAGSAKLTDSVIEALVKLSPILKDVNHYIVIAGHTDELPIYLAQGRYIDNWELSAMRSINVLRFLAQQGVDPQKMSAQSFGEYQHMDREITYPGKDTPEYRALNRRVDIIIETGRNFKEKE